MATKTPEQKLQDSINSMNCEMSNKEYRSTLVRHGIFKGRVRLDVSLALAQDSAKAEHEVVLAKASLINKMDDKAKARLAEAMAVVNGLGSKGSKPESESPEPTVKVKAPKVKTAVSEAVTPTVEDTCSVITVNEPLPEFKAV